LLKETTGALMALELTTDRYPPTKRETRYPKKMYCFVSSSFVGIHIKSYCEHEFDLTQFDNQMF